MTHVLGRVFLAATLLLLPFWRGDKHTSGAARGEVLATASTLTTKKIKDVRPGESIQIGSSKYIKIAANRYQAVKPYTCADPVLTYAGASKNFTYTGNYQTFTAYAGCQYKVELWGAQGGTLGGVGGSGGYSSGRIQFTGKKDLYIYVGEHTTTTITAAWNGGSQGPTSNSEGGGAGGGGATDIRTVSGSWNNSSSLLSRVIVAGGGGGASNYCSGGCRSNGGAGGGLTACTGSCGNKSCGSCSSGNYAKGGTQISGGTSTGATGCVGVNGGFGFGGSSSSAYGGAGGSGWYGGGGGGCWSCVVYSGSGGSSYISGHTGCVAVTSLSDTTPKAGCTTGTTNNACSLSPTGLSFTDTVMIDGAGYSWTNVKGSLQSMPNPSGGYYASGTGHTGHGAARITRLN